MFKEKGRTDVVINKREAKSMLKLYNNYDGQRLLKDWKIKDYIKYINNGTMRKSNISIAHNKETGESHLMNGQHRLVSIIRASRDVAAVLVSYECENEDDMLLLYSSFDTGLARNISDISTATAKANKLEWSPKIRMWVVSYGQYYNNKLFSTGRSVKDLAARASVMKNHVEAGNFLQLVSGLFLTVKTNKAFNNVSIASCIMHSFENYGEKYASDFWEAVLSISDIVNEVPLGLKDPRRVLRRTLIDAHSDRSIGWWSTSASSRTRIAALYQIAFMHFLRGKEITRIMYKPDYVFDWEPINKWTLKD